MQGTLLSTHSAFLQDLLYNQSPAAHTSHVIQNITTFTRENNKHPFPIKWHQIYSLHCQNLFTFHLMLPNNLGKEGIIYTVLNSL